MTTKDALARDRFAESANYLDRACFNLLTPVFLPIATLDHYDFRKIRRSPPPKKVKQEAKPAVRPQPGIYLSFWNLWTWHQFSQSISINTVAQRPDDDDDLKLLKGFDLNYDYGPNIGKLVDKIINVAKAQLECSKSL